MVMTTEFSDFSTAREAISAMRRFAINLARIYGHDGWEYAIFGGLESWTKGEWMETSLHVCHRAVREPATSVVGHNTDSDDPFVRALKQAEVSSGASSYFRADGVEWATKGDPEDPANWSKALWFGRERYGQEVVAQATADMYFGMLSTNIKDARILALAEKIAPSDTLLRTWLCV